MNSRIKLDQVAQMGLDLYYRNYKHDADYFDMPHFLFLVCATYIKMMNDMYKDEKMRNKDSDGYSYITLSGQWLTTELCEVKKDEKLGVHYIETQMALFTFDFDALCSSIHSITKGPGAKCGDIMRLSNKDYWKLDHLPTTSDIFWYQMGEKILLPKLSCNPGKLIVNYLPSVSPTNQTCSLPETTVMGIITTVLQVMFGAKNETMVVKMVNNDNPNVTPESELSPDQKKRD